MEYTITLSEEEEKALLTDMISIQAYFDNAFYNKIRQCIDRIVQDYSDKQPGKLTIAQKLAIVRKAKVKSAAERMAEFEAERR